MAPGAFRRRHRRRDRKLLTGAIARYAAQGVWGSDPVLPSDGFARLARGLLSGGFVSALPDYSACVDNRLAERALAEAR